MNRRPVRMLNLEHLQDFRALLERHKGNTSSILKCTQAAVKTARRSYHKELSIIVQQAACSLVENGVEACKISAILTRTLKGIVASRTVRDALEEKFKDPSKKRNHSSRIMPIADEVERGKVTAAAVMPQITIGDFLSTTHGPSRRRNILAATSAAVATTLIHLSNGDSQQWPLVENQESLHRDLTITSDQVFVPKEMAPQMNEAFALSKSGVFLTVQQGVAQNIRSDNSI